MWLFYSKFDYRFKDMLFTHSIISYFEVSAILDFCHTINYFRMYILGIDFFFIVFTCIRVFLQCSFVDKFCNIGNIDVFHNLTYPTYQILLVHSDVEYITLQNNCHIHPKDVPSLYGEN